MEELSEEVKKAIEREEARDDYQQGYQAAERGLYEEDNPHDSVTQPRRRANWFAGWHSNPNRQGTSYEVRPPRNT